MIEIDPTNPNKPISVLKFEVTQFYAVISTAEPGPIVRLDSLVKLTPAEARQMGRALIQAAQIAEQTWPAQG